MNDQRIRFSNVRWAGVADRARMGGLLLLACAGLCAGPSAPAAQFVPLSSFGALYDSFSVRGPYGSVLVSGTNLLGVAGAGMWGNNVVFSLPADVSSGPASAHAFYMGSGYEGVEPAGGLTEQDGLLYGMTALSGASGFGSVFTLDPNNYFAAQVLHTFAGGSDGFQPCGTVAVGGGALYGLTGLGGTAGQGTLFTVQINGDGYAKLHDFAGGASDGAQPCGSPVLGGALLFGVTAAGGSGSTNSSFINGGTLFKVGTNGSGFALLHSFVGGADGAAPCGSLLLNGATLYGMTSAGGSNDCGTVFKLNTNGTGYAVLYQFAGGTSDGAFPCGALTLLGTNLYGLTTAGGGSGSGTIFKVSTSGAGYALLHSFAGGTADGASPNGSLTLSGCRLYGVTPLGGVNGTGLAFELVANDPPVLVPTPATHAVSIPETGARAFSVAATDPEGSNLVYSWTWNGAAVGGDTNRYTRTTAWGDAGTHDLRVTVLDGVWTNTSTNWTVTVLSDNDGDGMANAWERRYGMDPWAPNDATNDLDHDGLTNLKEFQLGSCPTNRDTDGDTLGDHWEFIYNTNLTNTPLAGLPDLDVRQIGAWTTGDMYNHIEDMALLSSNLACLVGQRYDWMSGSQTSLFYIVDLSSPSNLVTVGMTYLPGQQARSVQCTGSVAYVGLGGSSGGLIQVVDCADPAHPALVATATTTDGQDVLTLGLSGASLFARTWSDTARLAVTLTTNLTETSISSLSHTYGNTPVSLLPKAGSLYVTLSWWDYNPVTYTGTNAFGLDVFPLDVDGNVGPVAVSLPGSFKTIAAWSNALLGAASYAGYDEYGVYRQTLQFTACNLDTPTNPVVVGHFNAGENSINAMTVSSNLLVCAGWPSLYIFRIDSPTNLVPVFSEAGYRSTGQKVLAVQDRYLVVTWNGLDLYENHGLVDTDQDGLPDWWELFWFGDLVQTGSGDSDRDTLSNWGEYNADNPGSWMWRRVGLDPTRADTDYDGLSDSEEVNTYLTDPTSWDTDWDGINDLDEINGTLGYVTDPLSEDTDGDGIPDYVEIDLGRNPLVSNDVARASVSGTVTSGGAGLLNAYVELRGRSNTTYSATLTDISGVYHFTNVVAGTYYVKAGAEGYADLWHFQACPRSAATGLTLAAGSTNYGLNFALQPGQSPAYALVTSVTNGAQIYLDYQPTTNLTTTLLDVGEVGGQAASHTIVVKKAGCAQPAPIKVNAQEAETIAVNFDFTDMAGWTGGALISTVPDGADVYVDYADQKIGVTPLLVTNLEAASQAHVLLLKKAGYLEPRPVMFHVQRDTNVTVTIPLTAVGAGETLKVRTDNLPADATVYVDYLLSTNVVAALAQNLDFARPSDPHGVWWAASHSVTLKKPGSLYFAPRYLPDTTNVTDLANLLPSMAPVALVASPANGGRVTGGGTYAVGTNIQISATASNTWTFMAWSDGNTNSTRSIAVPVGWGTYTASFAHAITITVLPSTNAGGTVTGGGSLLAGSSNVLTAAASNGWRFVNWSDGVTGNPRTIVVVSNMTYTANFAALPVMGIPGLFPVATNTSQVQVGGSLASCGTNYLVGYMSDSNVMVKIVQPDGATTVSGLKVGNTGAAGVQSGGLAAVAYGTPNYLVAWTDGSLTNGENNSFGRFVSPAGALVGPVFAFTNGPVQLQGLVSDGTNFTALLKDGGDNLWGQRIAPDGTFPAAPVQVTASGKVRGATLVFGRTNYLVAWQSHEGSSQNVTDGAFLSLGGVAGAPFRISQLVSVDQNPLACAFDGTNYLVAWNHRATVPWSNSVPSNVVMQIHGRLVAPDGTLPGSEVTLRVAADYSSFPALAFGNSCYLMMWTEQASAPTFKFQFYDRSANAVALGSITNTGALLAVNSLFFDGNRFVATPTFGTFEPAVGTVWGAFITPFSTSNATVSVLASPANGGRVTGGGVYPVGGGATLTALASNNWLFTRWNDNSVVNPRTIIVPATNITYTASFAAAATVAVLANTNAGGFVTGDGVYVVGSNALLTATASNDWRFIRWNDGSTNNPRTIVVGAGGGTYTAIFAPTAVINVLADPTDGGRVTGAGTYVVGSNAVLSATASNNWRFIRWENGATNTPRTVVVPAAGATYTATFQPLGTVVISVNPTNGGRVAGGGQYLVGSNATLLATASNSWVFLNWNGSLTNNPWVFSVDSGSTACTANFARVSTVTGVASPTNAGSVSGGGQYLVGSNATVTATASNSWRFLSWNGGVTNNNPWTFVVSTSNQTCTASFLRTAVITVIVNTNDGGSVTGGNVYDVGSNAWLTATASNGWRFIRWSDGATNTPRSVMVGSADASYTAIFAPTALIDVLANPVAGGRVTGGGTYLVGSNAVLAATASNNWRFIRWENGATNTPRTVVVPNGGATYTATFQPLGTVVVVANPTSGGRVTGGGQYLVGSNATVTATASNTWQFLNWNGGLTNSSWMFSVVSGSTTCTANFAKASTVTVLATPAGGGMVTGGGVYLSGSNVNLTATAASNWLFRRWNDGNTNASRTITVPVTNITYTATFTPPATITVLGSPAYAGTVSGGGTYQVGSNVNLTATAAPGWLFSSWSDHNLSASRILSVPASNFTYVATFARGLGAALDASNLTWTTGGSANWAVQGTTTHDGVAALQSGAIGAGQQTWFQTTTNGPGSLMFWWKASSASNNYLKFYINTQLVSQIAGNVGWNQYVGFIGTSNQVTLKWVYTNSTGAASGSNAGWVDQINWMPCPYAEHVPLIFYQDPTGLLASWVLGTNASFQFARILANTGGWALKAAGDVDGDGVSDLLFETAGGATAGWFMNADGSTRGALGWPNLGSWEIKACGDFEGRGNGQVFFQNAVGVAAYWRLDTNGNPLASIVLGNMGAWKLRGTGDLDGDSKAEVFWQNAAGTVVIWYHNPDGSIRGGVPFNTGNWALCGVADIDGDHVSDLVWQNSAGQTGGWFMNTNGTARSASYWWGTGAWKLKAAGR